jgi:glycolate oxidase
VAEEIDRMSRVLRAAAPRAWRVSSDEAERLRSGRAQGGVPGRAASPDYMCMDGTIPRKRKLAEMLIAIQAMEKKYGLRCMNVFHAGDGNLHPLILFDANEPDELQRAEELFGADILELRGAGRHHHRRARRGRGEAQPDVRAVQPRGAHADGSREARVRPAGLLNPGKVIPTLHRCAEYGKMHVKKGLLPFAELPRF